MKKIEYKVVQHAISFGQRISGNDFGENFLQLLTEQGQQGWDLKEVIRESGMNALIIFSREVL